MQKSVNDLKITIFFCTKYNDNEDVQISAQPTKNFSTASAKYSHL